MQLIKIKHDTLVRLRTCSGVDISQIWACCRRCAAISDQAPDMGSISVRLQRTLSSWSGGIEWGEVRLSTHQLAQRLHV